MGQDTVKVLLPAIHKPHDMAIVIQYICISFCCNWWHSKVILDGALDKIRPSCMLLAMMRGLFYPPISQGHSAFILAIIFIGTYHIRFTWTGNTPKELSSHLTVIVDRNESKYFIRTPDNYNLTTYALLTQGQ